MGDNLELLNGSMVLLHVNKCVSSRLNDLPLILYRKKFT